jgi:hypothetical protein
MKKIMLILCMILSAQCFSQIEKPITKGNVLISGGGTIQYQKDEFTTGPDQSSTSHFFITFNPGVAFFIANHLAIGLYIPVFYNGTSNNKYYSLGIGPIIRFYFNNGIFLKGEASYSYIHNLSSSQTNEKFLSVTPGAGYAFFLNQKVSLEPCICYEFDDIDYNSTSNHKINALRLELKLSIFL